MKKLKLILLLMLSALLHSCVAYLPPSSFQKDMTPTVHPVYEGSDVKQVTASASTSTTAYHVRGLPEAEDSESYTLGLGYGIAKENLSAAIASQYSFGDMILSGKARIPHQDLSLKSSISYDLTYDRLTLNVIRFQLAASRGFGQYQDTLAANQVIRTDVDRVAQNEHILWSYGFGSHATMRFNDKHAAELGFYINRSTEFDEGGFDANFYSMQLGYSYKRRVGIHLGGMLDAFFLPRSETGYVSLSYSHPLRKSLSAGQAGTVLKGL